MRRLPPICDHPEEAVLLLDLPAEVVHERHATDEPLGSLPSAPNLFNTKGIAFEDLLPLSNKILHLLLLCEGRPAQGVQKGLLQQFHMVFNGRLHGEEGHREAVHGDLGGYPLALPLRLLQNFEVELPVLDLVQALVYELLQVDSSKGDPVLQLPSLVGESGEEHLRPLVHLP